MVNAIHKLGAKARNFNSAAETLSCNNLSPEPVEELKTTSAYQLAFTGNDFLLRDDMRHVRLQLEYEKCHSTLEEHGVNGTIVIFGSARIRDEYESKRLLCLAEQELSSLEKANAKGGDIAKAKYKLKVAQKRVEQSAYYDQARALARIITDKTPHDEVLVATGGGPGIMVHTNHC
jgi:hypothetical protein